MLKGAYTEWDQIGLCGIAGKSGSGKSSTMRLLLAQMAMGGTGLIVADGHGKFGQQNLASTIDALSDAFIYPVASSDDAIYDSIMRAYQIAKWRAEHWDSPQMPGRIALVIDEISNILLRCTPEQSKNIVDALVYFATQARKTNVKTFIGSQNWTQDFIGSAAIRKSMNVLILHKVAPDEVSKFTNVSLIKKSVPNMRVGEAWIINGTDPVRTYIPKVTTNDLTAIANRIIPYELTDDVISATGETQRETFLKVSNAVSPLQSRVSSASSSDQTQKLLQIWYTKVRKCYLDGLNKTDTIHLVWNVSPGSSKRYKVASRLYDSFKDRL